MTENAYRFPISLTVAPIAQKIVNKVVSSRS